MSGTLLLQQFTLIAPSHPLHRQSVDLWITDGMLQEIGASGTLGQQAANQVVEGGPDAFISAGWVDMQCHLSDPGRENVESLSQLAEAAVRGGFTQVLAYPNTEPVLENGQMIAALKARAAALPIELLPCGTLTEKAEGHELAELFDMQQAGARAFTDGTHPVSKAGTLLRALRYTQAFEGLIIHYPTTPDLTREGQMNEGKQSTLLGMPGIPEEAESIALARDLEVWSYAPQQLHLQPITSPLALDLIQSRYADASQLSVGCPIYYFLLDDSRLADYDSSYKVIPPLRNAFQLQRLLSALQSGEIDVLTSGHQARDIEEKDVPFPAAEPGMHSLATFFPMAVAALLSSGALSIEVFVQRVSQRPRQILGLEEVSFIPGTKAEYTLFAPDRRWTFHSGMMKGRAVNSPLLGYELQGKVLGVVQKGRYTTPGDY